MMNSRNPQGPQGAGPASAKEAAMKSGMTISRTNDWDLQRMAAFLAVLGLSLLILIFAAPARAQGVVRAWGMGGTGTAAARGLEAVVYNPANLAFSTGTTVGLAAAAADVHNNALSLERYNEITGQHLDGPDKARLLGDIPESGLNLDADVSASALGFQTGSFAVSFSGIGAGQYLQQHGVVAHCARQWPDVVKAVGERKDTAARDPAIGRFHADKTAARCRIAHATAGVAAQRTGQQAGGDRCTGSAG